MTAQLQSMTVSTELDSLVRACCMLYDLRKGHDAVRHAQLHNASKYAVPENVLVRRVRTAP